MAKGFPIEIKVISQTGNCAQGHKVGDTWIVGGKTPDPPMCLPAYSVMIYKIQTLRFGGEFPFGKDKDTVTATCPDTEMALVFQIRRLPKE